MNFDNLSFLFECSLWVIFDNIQNGNNASKLGICWCKFNFRKVWTVSFPKPSREYLFDPSITFYDFLKIANFAKNRILAHFRWFWGPTTELQNGLKIDLDVAETFWDQIWQAESPYFWFLIRFLKVGPFWNPNGNLWLFRPKPDMESNIPFWFQKGIKNSKFVDAN